MYTELTNSDWENIPDIDNSIEHLTYPIFERDGLIFIRSLDFHTTKSKKVTVEIFHRDYTMEIFYKGFNKQVNRYGILIITNNENLGKELEDIDKMLNRGRNLKHLLN